MAEKSLYEVQQKAPKRKVELAPEMEEYTPVALYKDDPEKTKVKGYLAKTFRVLDDSRPDDNWQGYIDQYNAYLVRREDGLANVNLPIEFATIRNKKADVMSSKSVVTLLPVEKDDIYKRELLREIWDYVWVEADTERELDKMWDGALIFGASWWFEGLHKETYTRYEPIIGKDGEVNHKEVTETKSWLRGRALDIRDVWVSSVSDLEDATECFIREEVTEEQLYGWADDPNFDTDAVLTFIKKGNKSMRRSDSTGSYSFQTEEELQSTVEDVYTVYHYYNSAKGIYIVISSDFSCILREGANPYPHGEIPLSLLIDHPKYGELYGRGECEILESNKYERNVIRNQIIDYARASNVINFAVGSKVSFEDSEMVNGVMNIWNFEGDLNNAQYIKPPVQDSSLFNLEEMFRNDATWETGVDNNALAGSPTKTAFEARLQEQTKLKGIMVTMKYYDFFLTRMARQRLANIQAWLPSTTGKRILGKRSEDKNYRMIALQDKAKEVVQGIEKGKKVDKSIRFTEKEGKTAFLEITPKLIKSNFDIQVSTPTTTPILRELDRQDLQDVFNTLMQMSQTPQGQQLLESFDFTAYYKDVIKQRGFDPDKYMKATDTAKEDKQTAMQNLLKDVAKPPVFKQMDPQTMGGEVAPQVTKPRPMMPGSMVPGGAPNPMMPQ